MTILWGTFETFLLRWWVFLDGGGVEARLKGRGEINYMKHAKETQGFAE